MTTEQTSLELEELVTILAGYEGIAEHDRKAKPADLLVLEEPRQASAELLERLRPAGLRCSACGKRLKPDHCVIGKNKTLTDGHRLPRYCWPGEGCNK